MSIEHVHDIYERVCEFGGKTGGSIQLFEAANGDNCGRQIVAIAIHYVRLKTASTLALTLTPLMLIPETMETSRDVLMPSMALTVPVFASDPSFASAATFLVGAINASCTEIIMALGPATELDASSGNNALA